MKRIIGSVIIVLSLGLLSSCYTLRNEAIPPGLKTLNIQFFENNAPLVVNNLSQTFTEALKERVRTQSRLSLVRGEADATLSGSIVGYTIAPVSIEATSTNTAPIAGANRLSITVKVKFVYDKDKKINFDESMTRFADYKGDIGSQEQNLIQNITKQLTEDIYNKAFSNW
jgi:hypothetical protein